MQQEKIESGFCLLSVRGEGETDSFTVAVQDVSVTTSQLLR